MEIEFDKWYLHEPTGRKVKPIGNNGFEPFGVYDGTICIVAGNPPRKTWVRADELTPLPKTK